MVSIVGKDPAQVKRTTCRNCASILEYTQSEVEVHKSMDYGGGHSIIESIICPCCSVKVIVRST